jgi:diguanylate cyclase (GGDEF)-like protein
MTYTFETILPYTQPLSILYVEDDPDIRKNMSEILTYLCDHLESAANGKEGIKKYQDYYHKTHTHFDIIITDILMPECDGISMSRQILQKYPDQEIIVTSAQNDSQNLIEMINMGISYFLLKPIHDTNLFSTLYHAGKRLAIIRERHAMTEEIQRLNSELEEKITKLEKLAREDVLTGIANRRYFYEEANSLFTKAKKEKISFYLAVMDIDLFKQINDHFGHIIGDHVITFVAQTLQGAIGEKGFLGRVGGDEFMMLFPSHDLDTVLDILKKAKERISLPQIIKEEQLQFSISIGVTQMLPEDTALDDVISRADKNLYKAKENGRNCIIYEI